jgi:hypothetical protein
MKRKGISQQTIARYMAAFVEMKIAIENDPKCSTSEIAKKFRIGQHPITMLRKMKVIERYKGGVKKWIGPEPNVTMVIQIAEAVHNYHAELRSRKSKGELFDKKITRDRDIKALDPTAEDLNEWKGRYSGYKAEKTDIPIQTAIFDKSTADHFVDHGEMESSKPEPRKFEIKIFGFKLFTINY